MVKVVFRVDASTQIGSGHVMRCLALADALRAYGAVTQFVSRPLPGHLCDLVAQRGHAVQRLPEELALSTLATESLLRQCQADWLIVDHYELDGQWERQMRSHVGKLMVIDDLAAGAHQCDVLLNQNPSTPARYSTLIPPLCRTLLGPRYALLRPEFAIARVGRRARDGAVRRVLLCFGGSDPDDYTGLVLQRLLRLEHPFERIDVVVGSSYPHHAALAARCAPHSNVRLHCPAMEMATLLSQADLAVGAGGAMNWERACLGVPSLVFATASNQRRIVADLCAAGLIIGTADAVTPATISAWLRVAIESPALLQGLAQRSAALVDGYGVERVVRVLLPTVLNFRPAALADSESLFHWRGHPSVRAVSHHVAPLERVAHQAWLQQVLQDPNCRLLIAEHEGQAVGVVRFDLTHDTANISVYRVPTNKEAPYAVLGLVQQATDWLLSQQLPLRRIVAEVLPDNLASLAAFRRAGYHAQTTVLAFERPLS